ncbi:phosphoenolpyruvate--protein phosphotransferase [Pontiella agarivorans]|uniref:Phosphoenolpyruvate-protein phosphotransferase n=1 Tax=Pontiella agarivorans TaxID=3038953 RepID=A0ABU5N0W5_9BACT|nr:phosphoenolpyruvate--protein phosphotransferase [Pontiella agarivorans]MDZ8120081.1 phosphoenolpyruvate--protein phosphotransferase [Pontiella agarivorans]
MSKTQVKNEIALKGIGVSPGIAVYTCRLFSPQTEKAVRRSISADEVPVEIARFEEALIATHEQIKHIQKQVAEVLGDEHASIFDAHILVVDDRTFIEEVIRSIKNELINVEPILQTVSNRYAEMLSKMEDSYLSERAADIRDVTKRILANLAGETIDRMKQVKEPCIVVAHDLAPSDTASIDRNLVKAFVTDLGSSTSHTAIMAKALEVPAVVGLHNITAVVSPGDLVLLDGAKGLVFVNPSEERLEEYRKRAEEQQQIRSELESLRDKAPETLDGYLVPITANIELLEELDGVDARGAKGIGLFRTEFLFLGAEKLPSEDEQAEAYIRAAKSQYPSPVVIRTLDLGADKMPVGFENPDELNPFLGDRAIRLCLARPELFKTQLRAILRASVYDNVRMMYPMVCCVREVRDANTLLRQCMMELSKEGIPFNQDIQIGTMIEVPSAALIADIIAPHVSFFSLGTNDLIQYTMAVDRGNENVAHLYTPTHMAIIRLIDHVVNVSHKYGLWTCVCGQMASTASFVPLLIGLGVDELSVSPSQAPLIKDVIRKLYYSSAVELAQKALNSHSAEHVERLCHDLIRTIAPEILELSE